MDKDFFDKYFDDDDQDSEDEYDEEQEHNNKTGGKTFTKGFLTALAICVVAIGAAVWTTVNNISTYLNPEVKINSASETDLDTESEITYEPDTPIVDEAAAASDAQVNATVSGVKTENESDTDTEEKVIFTVKPVSGDVICDYSEAPVYNETLKDYRAHPAIDYAASVDDKVRCMASGVVKDIYCDEMLGNVVVVEHSSSICSMYCGLAKTALVQVGDEVTAGDFVGTVYAIPCETADKAHVHVAATKDGNWINPEDLMKSNEN